GLKWRMVERKSIVGALAVFPTIKFPTSSSDAGAGTGTTDVGAVLISSHALGPVSMDLNVGYTHRSGDGSTAPRDASVWAVAFGGPGVGVDVGVADLYVFPAPTGPAGSEAVMALLGGPTFKLRPWLVVDAGVIAPIAGPQPRAVYGGGVDNIGQLWH